MNYLEQHLVDPPSDPDDDDYEDDDDDDEEEEEDNDDGVDADGRSGMTLRQVLYGNHRNDMNSVTATVSNQEVVDVDSQASENDDNAIVEGERESSSQARHNNWSKGGEPASLKGDDGGDNEGELNRGDMDGLFCSICFEAWSSGGDHHVCCLPCGHIYGLACIKKWLRRQGSSKCPQCKKKCGIKDIRLLYASRIVAIDGELQKKVQSLEAKCATLEEKRNHDLADLLEDTERRASGLSASGCNCRGESILGFDANPKFNMRGCSNKFIMQKDFQVDGARLFDIDSSGQSFVIARRLSGMGGAHVLTKVSLLSNNDKEDIRLPENTKAVKDLQVSPHARLVLLASLGKNYRLLESNNAVLTYELPAAAWSCSWDISSSHYAYAGLQNGMVLQFDMRYTMRHVQSFTGLTCNPIHTLYSLLPNSSLSSGVRSILSASSLGLCQWNFGGGEDRPYLIPESDEQGVCISLAFCKSSDDIVASYRPKIEISGDLDFCQPTLTAPGQGTRGSHVLYRKMGCTYKKLGATCANVSDIRLPKSTIIDGVYRNPVFASSDELTSELVLQELPSLMVVEHLKPKKYPIRDVKYNGQLSSGLLSCLTEDSLQLFTAKLL
ncbi:UNVERIFIED_CONTAM: hypothetical protein Sradi_3418200 [Sesamum radiatum]|uniref:RING-type E3 ubiquitin transferase n=1 Tax=Sesamum radiatum TaxID=300843 RepID=A0AAW2R4R3_SESRA